MPFTHLIRGGVRRVQLRGMSALTVRRPSHPLRATIALPRSKSVSNRALIIASLLGDLSLVSDLSDGDDTRVMRDLLRERPHVMDCGAGGTTLRFLLAWAAVQEGEEHVITGIPRLLQRPHDDLVMALKTLGADIEKVPQGFRVRGRRMKGGYVHFDSPISSQYLSALVLIAPCLEKGLDLKWTGTRLSEPFVSMTLKMLDHFGVRPSLTMDGVVVPPGRYTRVPYTVPPDWSSAAFWFEQVALDSGAEVLLKGLEMDTLQGDREAAQLWSPWVQRTATPTGMRLQHRAQPGAWPDDPVNLQHVPDLFQPLAFTLAGRGLKAAMVGLDNLVVKETNRLRAVGDALNALGCTAGHRAGTFIQGGRITHKGPFTLDPDIDHRMALAVAPLALLLESVTITDPDVVDKSYPGYWDDLRKAGYTLS
ncbi:MAG: 3-phosphoshikimate 1-carboxyvinyltransferase [Flavobacteriales bacterium]|nr:MAG: 3-phosphoshikimate 1-carboxyvinyltransferase [Flavobacteriales bacterium]